MPTSSGVVTVEASLLDGARKGEFPTALWSNWGFKPDGGDDDEDDDEEDDDDDDDEEYIQFYTKSMSEMGITYI